ncbi:hypothetical protein [Actinoplanes sp. RD1]|uniref:hypothetical protein n=1 Tax=Actinoplanes sp. RD1 TaxID=3064538 RepID=UPI002740BFD6|nr:hypothetical protein [Actinoplanes sp. RD1]
MTRLIGLNAILGVFAICPLTGALSLLAYASSGPYAPGTNHTYASVGGQPAPLEIDTDEAGIVAMGLLVAAMVLVPVFFAINIPLVRQLRPRVPPALAWCAALVVVLLPFGVVLTLWW